MSSKAPTIEAIELLWEKDSRLDKSELTQQSLDIDYTHSKYLKIYRQCKEQYSMINIHYNKLSLDAREYYGGKASPEIYKEKPFDLKVLKPDLDRYVGVDPEVAKAKLQLEKSKLKIELCESILKQLSFRSLNIKNIIAYIQFLSGER